MTFENKKTAPLIRQDGNIGAGPSTLQDILVKRISGLKLVPEPIKHWQSITDKDGKNILDKFYLDPIKYAGLFQMYAFITRLEELHKAYNSKDATDTKVWLSERSIHSDMNIFATNAYETGLMDEIEFKVYEDTYNTWLKLFTLKTRPDLTIYIRTSPKVCMERIKKRARTEEKTTIKMEYLEQLHKKYEEWLGKQKDIIIIDGDTEYIYNEEEINKIVATIQEKLKQLS